MSEHAEALRGLRNLKVLLGMDVTEVRGWAPAVQQAAQRAINAAIVALTSAPTVTFGPTPPQGPCTVCGKAPENHGSYPTCATHPFTVDDNCKCLLGARCVGAECVNGCVRGLATSPQYSHADVTRAHTEGYKLGLAQKDVT